MKKILSAFLFIIFFNFHLYSDEGMWLLSYIDRVYGQMKELGLELNSDEIYSLENKSLNKTIVGLGREGHSFRHFCSAGIISGKGLLLTNHHCAYRMIQNHSDINNDYLKDGFWATSTDMELPNKGITASIMVRMEDVTDKVLSEINEDMDEEERNMAIRNVSTEIEKEAVENTYYSAAVLDVFNNNRFYLFIHKIYKDVRLVGAPPTSLGKFGGETDNWMWPRHTADFTLLRIYTAPDGSPAKYSEDNIPLEANNYLEISLEGYQENDFSMVMGFPGTTNRYMTSFELKETMEVTNYLRHKIRDVKLDVIRKDMIESDEVRLKYASKFASVSNFWKYAYEQNKALKNLNTISIKKHNEEVFAKWVAEKPEREEVYGKVLQSLSEIFTNRERYAIARMYHIEGLVSGPELPRFAYRNVNLLDALKTNNQFKIKDAVENAEKDAEDFYSNYNKKTEKRVIKDLFSLVYENLDKEFHPSFFRDIEEQYDNSIEKYVNTMFRESIFADLESFKSFLFEPEAEILENDIMFKTGQSIMRSFRDVNQEFRAISDDLNENKRLFLEAWKQINSDKYMYPDANSSIRLSFGSIKSYEPRDGVIYKHYTTIDGVMEKEDPECHEFYVPEKLKELYLNKSFGKYTNKNNEMPACFISNNDITGGNSGSPVLDSKGRLIGVAFDGNSEAMSGDIHFETNLQRCIAVDVRYVLFIIDKFANANNLIKELKLAH